VTWSPTTCSGLALLDTRRREEGEDRLRRAAQAGHAKAMAELGAVFHVTGRPTAAEPWARQAVEAGDRLGMAVLGVALLMYRSA
jgi:TPR repeat protein